LNEERKLISKNKLNMKQPKKRKLFNFGEKRRGPRPSKRSKKD